MRNSLLAIAAIIIFLLIGKAQCSELSSRDQIRESWGAYKNYFIQEDGRVKDYYAKTTTTSEGQSYALLRSVWMNDKETFDNVLNWTNNNIKVRGDSLFGWQWGENEQKQWTILDKSSATDGDQDIALALILAYERWNDINYLAQAKGIIFDIWNKEVVSINGNYYLTAGDWAPNQDRVKINPSYFAPNAYRLFAKYDKDHPWMKLVDSSYEILFKVTAFSKVNLPPDWAYINKITGEVSVNTEVNNKESDFSYDAYRTHWRIALDYIMHKDERALSYLKRSTEFLIKYWQINNALPTSVTIDGVVRKPPESYAIYGTALPAIALVNPTIANEIYYKKLAAEFIKGFWDNPKDYYGQNLVWFGIALWINIDSPGRPLSERGLAYLLDQ